MDSNYPPGVSGLEPQITGEWPVDPLAPWCDYADERPPMLWHPGTDEELTFATPEEARAWLAVLNGIASLYAEDPDE